MKNTLTAFMIVLLLSIGLDDSLEADSINPSDYYYHSTPVQVPVVYEVKVVEKKVKSKPASVKPKSSEECLAEMIWSEARGDFELSQIAVAYTAKTRAEQTGKSICTLVREPWQYEMSAEKPKTRFDKVAYERCKDVAKKVFHKLVPDPTDGATHFWNPDIVRYKWNKPDPKWSLPEYSVKTTEIHGNWFHKMI